MTLKQVFEPVRVWTEAKLAPFTRRVTSYWTNTKCFSDLAKKIFHKADMDNNGTLSRAEFYLCMLKVYEEVNCRLPTHVKAPTEKEMVALMKKVDGNQDGELDEVEFIAALRILFGASSTDFSLPVHVIVILLLRMALLPLLAYLVILGTKALLGWLGGRHVALILAVLPSMAGILQMVMEVVFRSVWHSAMDD